MNPLSDLDADVRRIGGLRHRASFPPPAAPWCLVVLCTGADSAIPHWTSTTVRPTGARLRVRCFRARGSIGAPGETAHFKRSNGTGFDSPRGFANRRVFLGPLPDPPTLRGAGPLSLTGGDFR